MKNYNISISIDLPNGKTYTSNKTLMSEDEKTKLEEFIEKALKGEAHYISHKVVDNNIVSECYFSAQLIQQSVIKLNIHE